MFKVILLSLSLAAFAVPPALAQYAGANDGDTRGNFTYKTKINYQPVAPSAETADDRSGEQGSGWGDVGDTQKTHTQGFKDGNNTYGPDMRPMGVGSYGARSADAPNPTARGGSGAAQGGPVIVFGKNTFLAPSNMALRTQYAGKSGGLKLPETHMDSFVHQARIMGHGEHIYGDEGTYGPPPYNGFNPVHYIETGIRWKQGLTTGHPSDAPSAWGTPLKYNSMGGVIKGE